MKKDGQECPSYSSQSADMLTLQAVTLWSGLCQHPPDGAVGKAY
jgi:hypothetical protein